MSASSSLSSSVSSSWRRSFSSSIADVGDGMNYSTAASRLRSLISAGHLELTDIENRPATFFEAHRLLAEHATKLGPGFFIRFTVHFNLFAGTVVALGSRDQIDSLVARNKIRPRLGCFALTEKLAGVNSGLVVETVASYDAASSSFIIHSPSTGSHKNWISQGLVADEAVVIALLTVNGVNYGPQAFLVEMRDEKGTLQKGITVTDMGIKTVGNDLDNASIEFTNFKVPRSALLERYLSVTAEGKVVKVGGEKRTMDMIGQRLFTGRVAVAQAAFTFAQTLKNKVKSFADAKVCWSPPGVDRVVVLSSVPQIRALFLASDSWFSATSRFLSSVESELCACLSSRQIPPIPLQQAIATAKVKAIEGSIEIAHRLRQEVGSYALMAGSGFEQSDFLQCCKFAEGDSRILMQKMSRDIVRESKSKGKGKTQVQAQAQAPELDANTAASLSTLLAALHSSKSSRPGTTDADAWDDCHELVYDLAEASMLQILKKYNAQEAARLQISQTKHAHTISKL